jgi:CRISPR-associated protein Cas1
MQLILNTFGASLRKADGMFLVVAGERSVKFSPRKVQSICITTGAHLSTDALRLALEHHIDVVLLDSRGDPYGRFWHCRLGSTTLLRRRLLEVASSADGLRLAKQWVETKLTHQAELLADLAHTRPDRQDDLQAAANRIRELATEIGRQQGESLDALRTTLMGLEGAAGREYFAALSLALPQRFRFQGRSRSPARDEFNCLLNYAYGVLYGLVERACLLTGLDPYIGLVHTDNYNKLSLVFDLIELFRVHAERVVVNLFAGRRVQDSLFDQQDGGFRLNADGRALLIAQFNEHLDSVKLHGRRRLKIRDTIPYECQRLAGRLLRGLDVDEEVDISVFDLRAEFPPDAGSDGQAATKQDTSGEQYFPIDEMPPGDRETLDEHCISSDDQQRAEQGSSKAGGEPC